MLRIAIIMTAFNRKAKTLESLRKLFFSKTEGIGFTVYLTDDGSKDGTSEEVGKLFPQVVLSQGNGSLFWAGGMNLSWKRAVADGGYNGYLWLNDDTVIKNNLWPELLAADEYCKSEYGKGGIYVGSTLDTEGKNLTYGGSVLSSCWRGVFSKLPPDGTFRECDIANGNITYISDDVVKKIGCFYPGYIHGADYDYTYWAHGEGFPVLLLRDYVGFCDNDHKPLREILLSKSLKERIKYLYAPNGMQLPTALLFQKRFFPHYMPLLFISYWTKAIFPWILKK